MLQLHRLHELQECGRGCVWGRGRKLLLLLLLLLLMLGLWHGCCRGRLRILGNTWLGRHSFSLEEKKRVGIANPSDDLEFNVVCDHSRAHTLDDDSLTLETETVNTHSLVARAQPVMGLVYSGGERALK
jgi:hypothetical protein